MRTTLFLVLPLLLVVLPQPAAGQWLPAEPIRLLDGQVRLGGEISATFGAKDDEAYFNYTDYERNALRTVRLALSGMWQPAERLAFLAEVRSDDFEHVDTSAAFVRVRPWRRLPLDIQAGRIPPVFGAFGRRAYQSDRTLIGYPLAYQYLTSLRPEALPATADDLFRMRARGWLSTFPVGSLSGGPGLPLISAFRWDSGVEARWAGAAVDAAVSVTTGTLSNPRVEDDNGGRQIAGRLAARPLTGLVIAGSGSRGAWISSAVPIDSHGAAQSALGADVEYSRDHWLVRGEMVWSRWRVPFAVTPPEGNRVSAVAAWVEGRYRITPRIAVAARADRLTFSRLTSATFPDLSAPWEAPVTRFELGGSYSLQRNLVLRGVAQFNDRAAGRVRDRTFLSAQVAFWF